ncbi:MAG: amidohydrolase family protein [bacterium]
MDFKDSIIMPGLVNLHTHLEYSHLKPTTPISSFVDWIIDLIKQVRNQTGSDYQRGVEKGINELITSGTTCVGEIMAKGCSLDYLLNSKLRGIVYEEIIGLREDEAKLIFHDKFKKINLQKKINNDLITIGLSSHSPYTVSSHLLKMVGGLDKKMPTCIHIAESKAESDFIRYAKGELVDKFMPFVGWGDIKFNGRSCSSIKYIDSLGIIKPNTLLIHCVNLDEEDIAIIKARKASVCLCPRSNGILGNGQAPVIKLIESNIKLGLGTDSLASNTSMNLFEEMEYILTSFKLAQEEKKIVSSKKLIELGTIGGARCLGMNDLIGSLGSGKKADLIVVNTGNSEYDDPYDELVLKAKKNKVVFSMINGEMLIK